MTVQENIEIKAQARTPGKHWSRSLRKTQQIPAVIYGPKIENINFSISEIDAVRYGKSKFENTIFTLSSQSKDLNGIKVLRKAMAIHPVSRRPLHIDYYAIDLKAEVRVSIPVHYVGKPEGIMAGGVVQEIRHEVEVECLPTDIPTSIEMDITKMQVGDVLHASDIVLPQSVKLITAPEIALVACSEVKVEEEKPAAVAAAPAEAAAAPTEKKD